MKTLVTEIFPNIKKRTYDYDYFDFPSYPRIVGSFGYKVLEYKDFGDYQGDSIIFLQDGEKIGYLLIGWGSCSGCDALQACDSIEEFQELYDGIKNSIIWKGSPRAMIQWIKNRDWAGQWLYNNEVALFLRDFVKKLKNNKY